MRAPWVSFCHAALAQPNGTVHLAGADQRVVRLDALGRLRGGVVVELLCDDTDLAAERVVEVALENVGAGEVVVVAAYRVRARSLPEPEAGTSGPRLQERSLHLLLDADINARPGEYRVTVSIGGDAAVAWPLVLLPADQGT